MNLEQFRLRFERAFPASRRNRPSPLCRWGAVRRLFDPCPDVNGMTSVRKQKLLWIAFSCLEDGEAYLEVGVYQGKSLISAMLGNLERPVYACDNFSEYSNGNGEAILNENLRRYNLDRRVTFFSESFTSVVHPSRVRQPVGLYFYDGAHDLRSQYQAIRCVEPLLAPRALVVIDDWRLAEDSGSYAEAGTRQAIAESGHAWSLLYELAARFNGDHELWWNGVGVFSFTRTQSRH